MMLRVLALLLFVQLAFSGQEAGAQSLPPPTGPVILTVSGAISETNAAKTARFDRAMMNRLPQEVLRTHTPWTEGQQVFEGVRLVDLLRLLKAQGKLLTVHALNDYQVELDLRLFLPFDPLLALRHNGEEMRIADKGPIWLVFPQDDYPDLDQARVHDLWVWQIDRLVVE
jgi:hypothetical protein